jgi:hypothetical protein
MLDRSGGWPAAPAGAAAVWFCVASSPALRPNRCPAKSAINATNAIAATPHGKADEKLRSSRTAFPAAAPHRWQNFAPGVSCAPQDAQGTPTSTAPQAEQNLPLAAAPHDGQVCADGGAGEGGVWAIQ